MPALGSAAGMGSIEDVEAAMEEVPLMAGTPAGSGSGAEHGAHSAAEIPSPHLRTGNCRICLETCPLEDLEDACACKGSLQRVHHACLQRWIDERDLPRNNNEQALVCEICKQPYIAGYRPPPPRPAPAQRMPRRFERVMVGQDLFVIVVDPQTGMATARPMGSFSDSEETEDDGPPTQPLNPVSACAISFLLFMISLLLLSHVFSSLVPGSGTGEPGSIPSPTDDEEEDEDLAMTLLLLWLILRLLVLVAPVYTISRMFERARLAQLRAAPPSVDLENGGVELRVVMEPAPSGAGVAPAAPPVARS